MLASGQRTLQNSASIMRQISRMAVADSDASCCSGRPGRSMVNAMPYYLGIDAGGSQTTCAVGDGQVVLGRSHGAACKLSKVGEKQARDVLQSLIKECCAEGGIKPRDITHTCIGIAGISGWKVSEWMRAILSGIVEGETKVTG